MEVGGRDGLGHANRSGDRSRDAEHLHAESRLCKVMSSRTRLDSEDIMIPSTH